MIVTSKNLTEGALPDLLFDFVPVGNVIFDKTNILIFVIIESIVVRASLLATGNRYFLFATNVQIVNLLVF